MKRQSLNEMIQQDFLDLELKLHKLLCARDVDFVMVLGDYSRLIIKREYLFKTKCILIFNDLRLFEFTNVTELMHFWWEEGHNSIHGDSITRGEAATRDALQAFITKLNSKDYDRSIPSDYDDPY
jgi:hypothetical protein